MQTHEKSVGVSIAVSRDYLTFSAAHFAQSTDGRSERLHGHNYTVRLQVSGLIDQVGYVIDFAKLKSILRCVTTPLNHRTLIPMESSRITTRHVADSLEVKADDKHYVFPLDDVVLLPIVNTTVEAIAAFLVSEIARELRTGGESQWSHISLRVEESPGQEAEVTLKGDRLAQE